jgi:hypothetical protein
MLKCHLHSWTAKVLYQLTAARVRASKPPHQRIPNGPKTDSKRTPNGHSTDFPFNGQTETVTFPPEIKTALFGNKDGFIWKEGGLYFNGGFSWGNCD